MGRSPTISDFIVKCFFHKIFKRIVCVMHPRFEGAVKDLSVCACKILLKITFLLLCFSGHHELSIYPKKELPFFILFTAALCSFTAMLALLTHQFPEPMANAAKTVSSNIQNIECNELRRKYLSLVQMYKIIFGYCDINCHHYFDIIGLTRTRSKHAYKIRPKVARTNYFKY